jgi:hypothetical protein
MLKSRERFILAVEELTEFVPLTDPFQLQVRASAFKRIMLCAENKKDSKRDTG